MADNRANLLYSESTSLSALLSNVVNSRNIINVGIITKVIDENFINVRLYNTDVGSNPTYISAVRLLHIGTSKLKIKVTPAVGDTVLLLANRDFVEVLENNHDKKAADVLVEPYSKSTMQAILISPEEDDNNKTAISINEDGNITLETLGKVDVSIKDSFSDSGNKLVDFVMDTENSFTLTTYDSGSAINTIKMSSDGVTTTTDKDINVEAKGNATVKCEGDINVEAKGNATVKCEGDLNVEAKGNATVKSPNIKLTGGNVEIGGSVAPSGQGALCGLPFCAYSGAPQTGKISSGT